MPAEVRAHTDDPRGAADDSLLSRLTTPANLILSAVLLIMALPLTRSIGDPDFWWHLKAGQTILAGHHLIATDPFTYTAVGQHWTMHEWGSEVVLAALNGIGGLGAIIAVLAVVTWLGLFAVYLRSQMDRPVKGVVVAGMVMAALVGYPVWGPRIQMLTFALTALVLLAAERYLRDGGRRVWLLVPLFVVWSNFHSGFIIGSALLAIIAVSDMAGHWLMWPDSAPLRRSATLLLIALLCTLAAAINPNGLAIIIYPFATVGSAAQQGSIQEWQSPDFHLWEVALLYAPMLISLVLAVVLNRRISARHAAVALTTIALSLQSVRNISLFVAGATPIWIDQVSQLITARRARRGTVPRPRVLPPLGFRVTVYVLVMALIAGLALNRFATSVTGERDISYAEEYPVCAVQWLRSTGVSHLNIFNQYGEGGYLAYTLHDSGDRVFIFGDAALMGDTLLNLYGRVQNIAWDWNSILNRYHTDMVLFDTNTPIVNVLNHSTRWKRVYHDARSEIFVPVDSPLSLPVQPSDPATLGPPCAALARVPATVFE